ncbi:MAG: hypothetical protein ACO2PN_02000 [Pyrobaculum sp.]
MWCAYWGLDVVGEVWGSQQMETRQEKSDLLWRRCRGVSRRLAAHLVSQRDFEGRLWRF